MLKVETNLFRYSVFHVFCGQKGIPIQGGDEEATPYTISEINTCVFQISTSLLAWKVLICTYNQLLDKSLTCGMVPA